MCDTVFSIVNLDGNNTLVPLVGIEDLEAAQP